MTIVQAYGGLANRMRVVLSWRAACGPLTVVWVPDGEIAGARWGDVFEPVHGVAFLNSVPEGIVDMARTCNPHPAAIPQWQAAYEQLRLLPDLQKRLELIRPGPPYGAMHVRRTDHVAYAAGLGHPTPDEEFLAWAETAPPRLYLATDNAKTQKDFAARITGKVLTMGTRIREHAEQDLGGRRNTSLGDAAVDLFCCAGAMAFKGTRESSFSDTVEMLQKLGGWWST